MLVGWVGADPSTFTQGFPAEDKLCPSPHGSLCPRRPSLGTHPAAGKGPARPPAWCPQAAHGARGPPGPPPCFSLGPSTRRGEQRLGDVPSPHQSGSALSPRAVPPPTGHPPHPHRDSGTPPSPKGPPLVPTHTGRVAMGTGQVPSLTKTPSCPFMDTDTPPIPTGTPP